MNLLTRRQALRVTAAGVATLALAPLSFAEDKKDKKEEKKAGYTLPKLPYAYDALEVSIDETTMKIHHDKHHQTYVDNANKALAEKPELLEMPIDKLLAGIKKLVPADKLQAAINNVGGHSNHTIFWEIMGPKGGGEPKGELGKAIDTAFKSFDGFQKALSAKAVGQFGSGWAWLVFNKDSKVELEVVGRPNQDSPYMDSLTPLVGVDVWEHAYYLKYQNQRAKYVEAWWKVVNWDAVAERYAAAKKG